MVINPLDYGPDDAILVNRLMEANRIVRLVEEGWLESLGTGKKSLTSSFLQTTYPEVVKVYEREAQDDFRTIRNGHALAAAFETWFLGRNYGALDSKLVEVMLEDKEGKVFDRESNAPFFDVVKAIEFLGRLEDGNYLTPHMEALTESTLFSEVTSREVANFLWFIKFEQAFRVSEALPIEEEEEEEEACGILSLPKNTKFDENPKGEVVTLTQWSTRNNVKLGQKIP